MVESQSINIGDAIARLVSLEGSAQGMSFYLWGKSSFLIGASPKNDIALSGQNIASEQAKIEKDEDSYVITNLSGGNTYINGEPVDIYVLQEGDHLRFGFDILAFNFREVTEKNIDNIKKDIEKVLHQSLEPETNCATIRVLEGINKNMIYPLKGKEVFLMGRGSTNDIKIVDSKISRVHCKIEIEGGEYILFDQQSTNGVYVAGEKKDIHPLEDGDHIRVGYTILEFRLPPDERTE